MISAISSVTDWSALQQMRDSLFAKMDTNGDGKIDKSELKASMKQRPPPPPPSGQDSQTSNIDDLVSQLLSILDTNKDGVVDADELAAALQKTKDDQFAKIDTDGDGKISKDELKAFLTKMQGENAEASQAKNIGSLVDNLFTKLDTNNDGIIDKDEFAAGAPPPPPMVQNAGANSFSSDMLMFLLSNTQGENSSSGALGQSVSQSLSKYL